MVNNKVLSGILIATMFIAVFGTLMSLNRIDGITGIKSMTGAWAGSTNAETYASINITINSLLRINFTIDNASFGSGYVAAGQSACVLSTGESATDTRCSLWNTPGSVHGFLLENIGNELAKVNISNTNWS
ncbi:MAG: hypothetical protein V1678_05245, partial [Candidatus Aenigmatarchaeota archaeon]